MSKSKGSKTETAKGTAPTLEQLVKCGTDMNKTMGLMKDDVIPVTETDVKVLADAICKAAKLIESNDVFAESTWSILGQLGVSPEKGKAEPAPATKDPDEKPSAKAAPKALAKTVGKSKAPKEVKPKSKYPKNGITHMAKLLMEKATDARIEKEFTARFTEQGKGENKKLITAAIEDHRRTCQAVWAAQGLIAK